MPLGQLTYLPTFVASNPFHRLIVKFSRFKIGSFEFLFTIEAYLLRYSWAGLLILFALVLPPLEEVDYVSTAVRLSTLVYPFFFIWSLTRISGVELMQLVLEGHWTGELMATPVSNHDLTVGFIGPIWLVVRQYFLISIFSLALYAMETHAPVWDDGKILNLDELIRNALFNFGLFLSTISWIILVYFARLWGEVRLRNGLIKGLATLLMLLCGVALLGVYVFLFMHFAGRITDNAVLATLGLLTIGLAGAAIWISRRLSRNFRRYLFGQLDIDLMIFDESDPHATAWHTFTEEGAK